MKRRERAAVPGNISEEYYPISLEILTSFSRYRPPVDLYRYREDIARLYPYSRKGVRLTNEQVDEVHALAGKQSLFVAREDFPIYSEHIVKQAELALLDENLKESEVAAILVRALVLRLEHFFEQPLAPTLGALFTDIQVFTEYVWQDSHRIKLFMRRLFTEHELAAHSINTLIVGSWLFFNAYAPSDVKRKHFDRVALGLALHDLGMVRVPPFVRAKTTGLKPDEREKVLQHPATGIRLLQKLDIGYDEIKEAIAEHHERLDGSGYPQKNPTPGKIGMLAAVADSFSAMVTKRPYAAAKAPVAAAQELAADRRYDTKLTKALANAWLVGDFDLNPAGQTRQAVPVQ